MTGLWLAWTILLGLVGLVWVSRHLDVSRYQRREHPLTPDSFDGPPTDPPPLSVLVAAKDEQDNIASCVTTLLGQDYPDFEVIAINDRSEDRTREILEGIDDPDGRFTVIHVTELPDGWFGKNNAMRAGVEKATGSWLCFTDADCRQVSPRTLSMAMRMAIDEQVDLLSVLPVLETRSVVERVIQPIAGAVMIFWFNPQRVNNPTSRTAYANGAFMLMRRETYAAIGGHERVKTEVNEDMHMARLVKEQGLRLRVVPNHGLYVTRMYSNARETWRGWSRIFYGCFGTFRRLAVSFMFMLIMGLTPWASAVVAWSAVAMCGWAQAGPWQNIAVTATLAILLQQSLLVRYYRASQARWWYAPTYGIGALVVLAMLVNAMCKLGGRQATVWRGTTYRGNQTVRD